MKDNTTQFEHLLGVQGSHFKWVHLLIDNDTPADVLQTLSIPKAIQDSLVAQETRPKCLSIEGGVFICLRAINFNQLAQPDDMVSLRIWMTKDMVISIDKQARSLRSISEINDAVNYGVVFKHPADWFHMLLEKISDKISDQIETLDIGLDLIEEQASLSMDDVHRQNAIDIRKEAAKMKRFIAPQRDALEVFSRSSEFISKTHSFKIKEQANNILRYLDSLEVIRERTVLIQDEYRHTIAERQSERMYVLSLVTAIFLPLSFLTGVFGMNVGGLPGIDNLHAFKILMIIMSCIAVVIFLLMRYKKWF
ncbi:zinc transporter [Pseudoalteromonas citrea]|uniref:Zinc transporter n=2 Tax=Pseudoalteromonas citrea TaxID=43655 RepID=A0AAD4AKA6_9GAMM|nr:zinc transporter ZntB [Pseudoalteromonas citrea]KAF7773775.1 zinc transporter [Pseudoalteromonas citrea]